MTFVLGIIFGGLGVWVIRQGLRIPSIPCIGIGLALCVFPYFVESAVVSLLIGSALFGSALYFRSA
jgi:hypothetical protein